MCIYYEENKQLQLRENSGIKTSSLLCVRRQQTCVKATNQDVSEWSPWAHVVIFVSAFVGAPAPCLVFCRDMGNNTLKQQATCLNPWTQSGPGEAWSPGAAGRTRAVGDEKGGVSAAPQHRRPSTHAGRELAGLQVGLSCHPCSSSGFPVAFKEKH